MNKRFKKKINNLAIKMWLKGILSFKDIRDLLPKK